MAGRLGVAKGWAFDPAYIVGYPGVVGRFGWPGNGGGGVLAAGAAGWAGAQFTTNAVPAGDALVEYKLGAAVPGGDMNSGGDASGVFLANLSGVGVLLTPQAIGSQWLIRTMSAWGTGGWTTRASGALGSLAPWTSGDWLGLLRVGNKYTVTKNGVVADPTQAWTDSGDIIPRNASYGFIGAAAYSNGVNSVRNAATVRARLL